MLNLSDFTKHMQDARDFINEKLILFNGGKKYGQIVFLAGGAGSGKGFASQKFMQADKFKVRDVDEMKKAFMKLDKLTKKYPEIRGLDLRKPEDVSTLHLFVDGKGIKDKTLSLLLKDVRQTRLPNIMFDITAKDIKSITKVIPSLQKAGYNPRDIHITWILTNYKVAMDNNAGRERVVPAKILLGTHVGAAKTMSEIAFKNSLPRTMVDGGIYVVLNNRENTVVWEKGSGATSNKDARKKLRDGGETSGDPMKSDNPKMADFKMHVRDFTYMTLKKPGKAPMNDGDLMAQLSAWIKDNAPDGWDKPVEMPVKKAA